MLNVKFSLTKWTTIAAGLIGKLQQIVLCQVYAVLCSSSIIQPPLLQEVCRLVKHGRHSHIPQIAGPSSEDSSREGVARLLVPARLLYTTEVTGCLAKGLPRPVGTSFQVATSHTLVLLSPPAKLHWNQCHQGDMCHVAAFERVSGWLDLPADECLLS